MFGIICTMLCILLEIPFAIKFVKAKQNFDIIRQTAILIIMIIFALLFFGIYKIGLFVIR